MVWYPLTRVDIDPHLCQHNSWRVTYGDDNDNPDSKHAKLIVKLLRFYVNTCGDVD
jgi:hypothetical protein